MTAQELHALVEPIREAMVKDGMWPERDFCPGHCVLTWVYDVEYEWTGNEYQNVCSDDDAHNAILVALLGWAMTERRGWYPHIWFCGDGHFHVGSSIEHGQSLLHALVSAYRTEKGIK